MAARWPRVLGRLDAGEFPIEVGTITEPLPAVLDPDRDPTIRSAA